MKSLSVLVADDEESIRSVVQQWLARNGHSAFAAASGREAAALLQQHRFDLVITDVLMSEGDGLDLIGELRRLQPAARILAMSGGGRYMESSDYLKLARGLGAHAAVMKPFDFERLQQGIELALGTDPEADRPRSS
jgi:DNA-binding NtrC family response regulator